MKTLKTEILMGSGGAGSYAVALDIPKLIDTRLLVTGNSGSGKSYMLRRLIEQAFGKVQVIVLDPEGEFATLREKYGFLLAGKGGEVQADPRAAALMARRLVELSVNAVIDLYELHLYERRRFVKLFIESLIDLPKELYKPVLVILDEAHLFAPQGKDQAESRNAVIDLMTRGRKRGICGILATQRLSKLDKDAAAEAKNIFVGGITLPLDQKSAAEMLGLKSRDEWTALRDIPPGNFVAFGPALSHGGVIQLTVSVVGTTHPKAGERHKLGTTATPEAIRKVASELSDLPQKAEEEAKTLQAAMQQIRDLKRVAKDALEKAERAKGGLAPAKTVEKEVLSRAHLKTLLRLVQRTQAGTLELGKVVDRLDAQRDRLAQAQQALISEEGTLETVIKQALAEEPRRTGVMTMAEVERAYPSKRVSGRMDIERASVPAHVRSATAEMVARNGNGSLPEGERAVLVAALQFNGVERDEIGALTGYKYSTRNAYVHRLSQKGYVVERIGRVFATEAGEKALGNYEPLPTGDALQQYWFSRLPEGERVILKLLVAAHPRALSREELGSATNFAMSTRNAYVHRLSVKRLVATDRESVRASDTLFD